MTPMIQTPPTYLYAIPTGTCEGGVSTYDGTGITITVYVGQCVTFSGAVDWQFTGIPTDGDVELVSSSSETIIRSWNQVGTYTAAKMIGTSVADYFTVVVLAETYVTVTARVTADNTYVLGYGSACGMSGSFPVVHNDTSAKIFSCDTGAESYTASMPLHGFIYVAAWDDEAVTQGVLGRFSRATGLLGGNPVVNTGDPRWRVYATGLDFDGLPGPGLPLIDEQIALANLNLGPLGSSSVGWVGDGSRDPDCFNFEGDGYLVVSEEINDTQPSASECGNQFGAVCGVNKFARWMWYDHSSSGSTCTFEGDGDQREFLIFRLPVSALKTYDIPYDSDVGAVVSGFGF